VTEKQPLPQTEKPSLKRLTPYQEKRLAELLCAYADWLETNYPETEDDTHEKDELHPKEDDQIG
jgi:hypothetical protein